MKKILIATALLSLSTTAFADDPFNPYQSGASSVSEGNVYVSSNSINPLMSSPLPMTTIGKDFTSCAGTKLSFAALPHQTTNDYMGKQRGASLAISLDVPLDWEGNISRCENMQKAMIIRNETENLTNIVGACMNARKQGFTLDPKVIPWAKYCRGIGVEHKSASMLKMRNENLQAELQYEKEKSARFRERSEELEFYKARVGHVEKHHFGKKVAAGKHESTHVDMTETLEESH